MRCAEALPQNGTEDGRSSLGFDRAGEAAPKSVVYDRVESEIRRASPCANWESPSRRDTYGHSDGIGDSLERR